MAIWEESEQMRIALLAVGIWFDAEKNEAMNKSFFEEVVRLWCQE